MERVKRFERSTPTLARLCSTPELHPLINQGPGVVGGPWRRRFRWRRALYRSPDLEMQQGNDGSREKMLEFLLNH